MNVGDSSSVHFKNEERYEKNVFEMKKYLEKCYHTAVYDHEFFKSYLLRYDNDLCKCLKKVDNFFAFKKMFPEYLLLGDVNEFYFNEFCQSIYSFHLPQLTEDGYCVFIDRVSKDERLFDVGKIIKYYCMQTEIRLMENVMENGDIILFDCNSINLFHFALFVPYFIKALWLILTIYPLRIKLLVLTNTGRLMENLITWLKAFLPKKIRQALFVYAEGCQHFSKHVNAKILPIEYGGEQFSMNELREKWYHKMVLNCAWYAKANNEITNMKIKKIETLHTSFGKNGTFTSLQLD